MAPVISLSVIEYYVCKMKIMLIERKAEPRILTAQTPGQIRKGVCCSLHL